MKYMAALLGMELVLLLNTAGVISVKVAAIIGLLIWTAAALDYFFGEEKKEDES